MKENWKYGNIPCVLEETEEFLVVKKPSGWATHASSPWSSGFAEWVSQQWGSSLLVVHRLDVGTSGLLLLAKSKDSAEIISQKFRNREIKKKYHFLTSHSPRQNRWRVESHLERGQDKITRSFGAKSPNAVTFFEVIEELPPEKDTPRLYLIRAEPLTGKPHQIRAHALESGVPLRGDLIYGGEEASRLFLAATHLEIDGKIYEDPVWREDFASGKSKKLLDVIEQGWLQRRYLLSEEQSACARGAWRWLHHEDCDLEMDVLGDILWISLRNSQRSDEIRENLPFILKYSPRKIRKCYVLIMSNRGHKSVEKELYEYDDGQLTPAQNEQWLVKENGLSFILRNYVGFSPGLFLDQRENRKWTQQHSKNKKVLNLFAYSGGFSVNAAQGGAQSVCTVDVSPTFLSWAKENFEINNLSLNSHEFWSQDSLVFLKGCLRRHRKFDLIICDPPSMGRTKEGVFRIEKDWMNLLELCLKCLSASGTLLFSNNFEKWSQLEWLDRIHAFLKKHPSSFTVRAGQRSPDFEPLQVQPAMKSFLIYNRVRQKEI